MNSGKYKKGSVLSSLSSKEKYQYSIGIVVIFLIIFGTLYLVGFVPETFRPAEPLVDIPYGYGEDSKILDFVKESATDTYEKPKTFTVPEKISIPNIGVNSIIEHPKTQDILTLDNALKRGAVYYPGSGSLEEGNVFLFGHSSNWKVVQNQAYKTFNGLNKLQEGEDIVLEAKGYEYVYKVDRVSLVDENTAFVNLKNTGNTLTISTCNTFGAKQERWVVEATFFKKRTIVN